MKIYLVGGAVRDQLLGLTVRDEDFVVVDATREDMLAHGYHPIGKGFPIFLHPKTRAEHALVRGEGTGEAALRADLHTRDLTINAMAMDPETGALVDPLGGEQDLRDRLLRPAPGFTEDPIRVLRAARFAARLHDLGFVASEELRDAMKAQVARGALATVPADRVWLDLSKALTGPHPSVFLRLLHDTGALQAILPEVDALYGVPQAPQWHPEVDTGVHTEMVVDMAARLAPGQLDVAWAALTHDLGKALTPPDQWPKHHGHETAGKVPLMGVHERLPVPKVCQWLAERVCVDHLQAHTTFESRAGTLHALFERLAAYQHPKNLDRFLAACEADKRGRLGMTEAAYPQATYLKGALQAGRAVSAQPLIERGLEGERLGEELKATRIHAIKAFKTAWQQGQQSAVTPVVPAAPSRPRRAP